MKLLRYLTLYSIFFSFATYAQLKEFKVDKYNLENGMTVLLHEDNRLPMYSLHLWYEIGSSDEDPNKTGLAHFFEHLMFKGTKKYKEGVYDSTIENNGGINNAFTTREHTGYYVQMPSGTLEKILELEADRMVNLELTEDKINREREVVKEERRMRTENSPSGLAFESLFLNTYFQNSYKWPVIGSMKHLENSNIQDFKKFYKNYYAPNNAILVIVGAFKTSKAKKWIKKYFGRNKPKRISRKTDATKVVMKNGLNIKIKKPVKSTIITISLPGTSIYSNDTYALDLLGLVLADGTSSRLHKGLVEEKKYNLNVSHWNFKPPRKGLLLFFNTLRPGVSSSKMKLAFKDILAKTAKEGVTLEELNAAKKRMKVSAVNRYKTLNGKAIGLALNELLFKDYKRLFTHTHKYQKISLKKINEVAKKYLNIAKLNIVEVGK